jgi:integrase
MAQIHLTDTAIAARIREAKETKKRIDVSDTGYKGLRARITGVGAKWYWVGKDDHGKTKTVFLGAYPAIGIGAAREAARVMREKVRAGADPTAEKRRKAALGAVDGIITLDNLLTAYTASTDSPASWKAAKTTVRHVFKGLLTTRLDKLRLTDIHIIMDKHPSVSSAALAGRNLRPCMKWGRRLGYVDRELTFIETKSVASRDRVLSDDELKALFIELNASDSIYAPPMRFLIWTLSRLNETCKSRWKDFNVDTGQWFVKETKTNRPLVLTLPRQAVAFLKARKPESCKPSDYIFPNSKGSDKPLSNWDRATKALETSSDWNRHDLRRTGATKLAALEVDDTVIDTALNHKNLYSRSLEPYLRARPQKPVSDALQLYADWLDKLIDSNPMQSSENDDVDGASYLQFYE